MSHERSIAPTAGAASVQKAANVELSSPSNPKVRRESDVYVVTFEHENAPGVRGADFDARVKVDARTGAVIEILGGP